MCKETKEKEVSKKRERKESTQSRVAGARACVRGKAPPSEVLPAVIDVKTPPTLELLLAFAHRRLHYFDDAFTREWHRVMTDELFWRDPKTGDPVRHWPACFRVWRLNREMMDKLRDPDRIPDARNAARRQTANHVEISKEERHDLLGKCGF